MTTGWNQKQKQAAATLVSLSGQKGIHDKHAYLRGNDQTIDPKMVQQHLSIVKKLLQRHVGQVGDLRDWEESHPLDF